MANETVPIPLETVQNVIDYIENDLCAELTPAGIAAHFYMSASALSALFKAVCGMTIMEYVRNRRLTLAAEELANTDVHVIDLAYQYGYETPEAFTKAFSRFHGFPPSFVRRAFPVTRVFRPLRIAVSIEGGWEDWTKADALRQDFQPGSCYDEAINHKGGYEMESQKTRYQIDVRKMSCQKEWEILTTLAGRLQREKIPFKIDGKTLIFAHGLESALDKICLTFKWKEEDMVRAFFRHDSAAKCTKEGFKYFDASYMGMKIRCMFYGGCPGDDKDEFLYRNTDLVRIGELMVRVQSLEFFIENAEKDTESYRRVEAYLREADQEKD